MQRHALSEEQWQRLGAVVGIRRRGPKSKIGDRLFIEAVVYRARTGVPWRDLPERFGPWKTVYNRFSNWAARGLWGRVFASVQRGVNSGGSIVDASVVRAHQDSSGASGLVGRERGLEKNALGRSRGGFSSKLHAVVDLSGQPLFVALSPGQRHEATMAERLLKHVQGAAVIGDTGYDSDRMLRAIEARGMKPVIFPHPCRNQIRCVDRRLYVRRYLVEVFFHRLKRFRGVATRYDKTADNYLAMVHFACALLWLGR